jgi:UDP:flavonoid glycosyltransferase YjiC (YdhE family)
MVFTPREFITNDANLPRDTVLTGSLPISKPRCEDNNNLPDKPFILLCFGSVLDPANYLDLTNIIIDNAKQLHLTVMMTTKFPELFNQYDHVTTAEYLPLPQLMTNAAIFIHHGGANTFSESLSLGIPQLLIPLTTDQPIQAEYLKQSGAGIAIYPHEFNSDNCMQAFKSLLDHQNPLHHKRCAIQKIFSESHGERTACDLIEQAAKR